MGLCFHAFNHGAMPDWSGEVAASVKMNGYAVLPPGEGARVVGTRFANVCAGLVAMNRDGAVAAAHVFSDAAFFSRGEARVRQRTREAWEMFAGAASAFSGYEAVTFGGQSAQYAGRPAPGADTMRAYYATQERVEAVYASAAYEAEKNEMMAASRRNDAAGVITQRATLKTLVTNVHHEIGEPECAAISDYMNHAVSCWINDTFHAAAAASGFMRVAADVRYQDAPHDGFADRQSGQIGVTHFSDPFPVRYYETIGTKIFERLYAL